MRETRERLRSLSDGELQLPEPANPSSQRPIYARAMSAEEYRRRTVFDGTASETDRFAAPAGRKAPWFAILATTSAILSGLTFVGNAVNDLRPVASAEDAEEIVVYAGGRHYHSAFCPYAGERVTLATARAMSLAPCGHCHPRR